MRSDNCHRKIIPGPSLGVREEDLLWRWKKVIQAILSVLHEGCTWRGINQPDANWNSVYQYYRRWGREGVWAAVWEQVAPAAKPGAICLDSTFSKVQRRGLNAAGGRD